MPNIELHGFRTDEAATMKRQVRAALRDSPDAPEIVTTVFPTVVEDLTGKRMPFLRIIATSGELPELTRLLKSLKQDMEVMPLGKWIPKCE